VVCPLPLAGLLARDLALDDGLALSAGARRLRSFLHPHEPPTPRRWVEAMEGRTELGRRYRAYRDRPAGSNSKLHRPVELQRRACWPNGDNVLALHVAWASARYGERVTLINTPPSEQRCPSDESPT